MRSAAPISGTASWRRRNPHTGKRSQTDSKLGPAYNNLAVIYMLTGRYPEARDALRRAEKSGLQVNPALKTDIEQRAKAAAAIR